MSGIQPVKNNFHQQQKNRDGNNYLYELRHRAVKSNSRGSGHEPESAKMRQMLFAGIRKGGSGTADREIEIRCLVEIRTAQVEAALRAFHLAAAFFQLGRTVRAVLRRIGGFRLRGRSRRCGLFCLHQAARSLAASDVRLQQSAMISHAPSRFQTLTYFPRSVTRVPSALCRETVNRPSSIAISDE